MSTIKEIIQRVDDVKPNCFPESIKLRWISLLDGKVAEGVYLLDALEARSLTYQYPEDLQHEPLIDFPYDDLYDLWLQAKIDFENGEYSKYQNTMEMFNSHYYDFVRWMAETYDPAQGGNRMGGNTYLLSAYALAVKHGFQGSEREWLQSLFGKSVELRSEGNTIQWRHEDDEEWTDLIKLSDERFFEVTADGMVSLKSVYRGAYPAVRALEGFREYGESDNGMSAAGSKNAELPKVLVLPDAVGGVKVKGIARGAFAGNRMIESISIPETVKEIPDYCFYDCSNLKLIRAVGAGRIGRCALYATGIEVADFPEVTAVGSSAFAKSKVREANLPSLDSNGMGQTAFDYCLQLETVHAGNLTTVPDAAFFGCCNLQTVSSTAGITSIGVCAFSATPKLTTVDLSEEATDIQAYAFYRSGFEYDWDALSKCAFGICATWKQLNPTVFWSDLNITECENPLPTLFNQHYPGWENRLIGQSGHEYQKGCVLFAFIHAYCGLRNMKLEGVEDFESIADSYRENILDGFKKSMEKTYEEAGFCDAFGLTCEAGAITGQEDLQKIYDALAEGKYVAVQVGTANPAKVLDDTTDNDYAPLEGHIALLYGVRKDGKLLVADSGISNDNLHGSTSAIHYKHFLHTGAVDGSDGVDATDYYIISNGEPTMSTIDNKLNDVLKSVAVRVESGSFTLENNTGTFTLKVPANAQKVVIRKNGEPTVTTSTPYFAHYFVYSAYEIASHLIENTKNAFAEYMAGSKISGSSLVGGEITDGNLNIDLANNGLIKFEAGSEYKWTAYCWDE